MILGETALIIDVLDISSSVTISIAKITIVDPNGSTVVDAQDLTAEGDNVYSYKYQSSSGGTEGAYVATLTYTTADGDTSIVKKTFYLVENDEE